MHISTLYEWTLYSASEYTWHIQRTQTIKYKAINKNEKKRRENGITVLSEQAHGDISAHQCVAYTQAMSRDINNFSTPQEYTHSERLYVSERNEALLATQQLTYGVMMVIYFTARL